jgi:multiple sugar transport system permease protein
VDHPKPRTRWRRALTYGAVAWIFILAVFPFYWMLITSLKTNQEIYSVEANPFYTLEPTLTHYVFLFRETLFGRWLWNTMVVALASTGISVAAAIPAGYALARLRFSGAALLGWLIFLFYLVPPTLLFIPLTDLVHRLGLANTLWALILTYPTFLIPFGTWLLTGYFRAIPRDMEECALVDGCTKLGAMVRIAVPLALPGLLSVFIFAFTLSWNEFIYAMTLVNDVDLRTVPVGAVVEMIRGDGFWWGSLMGAALLASVPVALLYSFFVEYFVAGLTAGAVKG